MLLNLSLTLPDTQAKRVKDSFAACHGWTATIFSPETPDISAKEIPNPETQGVFLKRKVIEFIKESVKAYEANQSAETARKAKIAEVDTISIE